MGAVSNAVLKAGGHVLGVIPSGLIRRERRESSSELTEEEETIDPTKAGSEWKPRALPSSTQNNETILVESMHERKKMMTDNADAIIVLPGGYGTLDELFEAVTWSQLNIHTKPVILLNLNGYYNHLLTFIDQCVKAGFVSPAAKSLIVNAETVNGALELCNNYQKQVLPGARFEALNWKA
jgi:predicted Rossmann-fold nucleotide-binding protein